MEPISQNALRFYERVAYDEAFSGMILDAGEGERLADLLGDNPVLVLRNHGVVVVGVDVAEAFDRLYYLERACETQLLAMATGAPRKNIDPGTARWTRDQWEAYPSIGRDHWAEIRAILDAESPDYRA